MAQSAQSFRVKSFVKRDSAITAAQRRAYQEAWPQYGLSFQEGFLKSSAVFGREAPLFLEIGFGSGQSLLALAKAQPENNFIGVETHKPGVGSLLMGIQSASLTNLRVYHGDVIDVLEKGIPGESLSGVQIFFPDPWQKRRHYPRRLIQPPFIETIRQKLKLNGTLHLATDWEDYAYHMMKVLSASALVNLAGTNTFATRSIYRPVVTKFEQRAQREGRQVWELQFQKVS